MLAVQAGARPRPTKGERQRAFFAEMCWFVGGRVGIAALARKKNRRMGLDESSVKVRVGVEGEEGTTKEDEREYRDKKRRGIAKETK